jgi:hypothetical protein
MSELSVRDQLFLNVGKCLTAWNNVENELLIILEYALSQDLHSTRIEVSIGYWSVVSFEARLRWCNSVMAYRLRFKTYSELMTRWNALHNKLSKKNKKRAEIAHGSVIRAYEQGVEGFSDYFIPYFHKRRTDYLLLAREEFHKTHFATHAKHLTVEDMKHRCKGFDQLSEELRNFTMQLQAKDVETEFHARQ